MNWKRSVDIWSIGCVILEFLNGSMVFNTHCPIDHLNQMQSLIGPIPQKLVQSSAPQKLAEYFHSTFQLKMESAKQSRAQARSLETYFDLKKADQAELYDLTKGMLRWFATDRITANEILQHNYWIISDPNKKRSQSVKKQSQQSPVPKQSRSFQTMQTQLQQQPQYTYIFKPIEAHFVSLCIYSIFFLKCELHMENKCADKLFFDYRYFQLMLQFLHLKHKTYFFL
ncbi:dual specificity protein kinase CLK4 isoform 4 [Reticulomyxa filosa]|uniref:Dual specificity protein kinase CLK4 isoform 4 n=1 Tax=Reticulomyxa filosa TaxID=46433 RepID=X6M6A2_RETFI|nr:dual specificity protein kinase CLK4 isoform 4 [Reticulomyxa filosa]|eukprot:ETO09424.1 dual specificity protein kinase CLK4 isoform 4 [Reticulomyxa filosa]